MTDRTQELAEVFARLRWCVGGEFSVTVSPSQAELLLDALGGPANWRASYFAMHEERDEAKVALDWYRDHKREDGSYDGELFGDLNERIAELVS